MTTSFTSPSNGPAGEGLHPRPQLVRPAWLDLSGSWRFAYDDDRVGVDQGWFRGGRFDRDITVPFPPESKASGVGDPGFHPVVWYGRRVTAEEVRAAGAGTQGSRVWLRFGAVDYRADVWLDGHHLGGHEGGHTPFSLDLTAHLSNEADGWDLVVRAEDDPHDVAQPRGKQDWQPEPHGIWYHRTTGIWQPVWLEAVPALHVAHLSWSSDLVSGTVRLDLELSERPSDGATVRVRLGTEDDELADVRVTQREPRSQTVVAVPQLANAHGSRTLLWSPDNPRLVNAVVEVTGADGHTDTVDSYLGLRSVGSADGYLLINDRPCYLRSVLAQGYWPESHLAAPSADALRAEVQLIKDLGFNAARVHQKTEDPRFLYWADRLGVLVWAEAPSAFEFSPTAAERGTREWTEVIRRDRSHPCIVTWVPLNESWGVHHIAHDPAQLAYAKALYHLTKALDPTRLVVSNDGWEHADSDLWTIHDYATTRAELVSGYPDRGAVASTMSGMGPLGRRMDLTGAGDQGQPAIVSEFGGISYAPRDPESAWGYIAVDDAADFERTLRELFDGVLSSPVLAGFCYTQLTDTAQETNGLTDPDRNPKLPVERLRSIVLGADVDLHGHRRDRRAPAQSHRRVTQQTRAHQEKAQEE